MFFKRLSVFVFVMFSVLVFGETGFAAGKKLDAPFIRQMPELPRGCEVTSLAMLLGSQGVPVSKMTLAGQVKKVPFKSGGFYGNPYEGFVGNMYTYSQSGYGVYHGPIAALAERYLPGRVVDFTGSAAGEIYKKIDGGSPVWVITNTTFKPLSSGYFQKWLTKSGPVSITYKEHSVLVTGYDSSYVYLNDPLYYSKNRKVSRKNFEASWVQMGRQAIAVQKYGADAALKKAVSYGGSLKWEVHVDYRKQTYPGRVTDLPRMDLYNGTKAAIAKAKSEIAKLPAGEKKSAMERALRQGPELQLVRAQGYIDAVVSGKKLLGLTSGLGQAMRVAPLSDDSEARFHQLSFEVKKNAVLLYRVYGADTRAAILAAYKAPAERELNKHRVTISAKMVLDEFKADVVVSREERLADLKSLIDRIPDAETRAVYMKEWERLKRG